MKNLLLVASLIFLFNDFQPATIDYIEIQHTGLEEAYIPQLFITKEKIVSDINDGTPRSFLFKRSFFVISNGKTFLTIVDFVSRHPSLFTNKQHKNYGGYHDYAIIINGTVHNIFYRNRDKFFSTLEQELVRKKCDYNVINKVKSVDR